MKCFVTGGAGFIGSNLVDRLVEAGHGVTVYDNLSTGSARFLKQHEGRSGFAFVKADLLDADKLNSAMAGHEAVFHLAANADVRFGVNYPRRDLEQNTVGTFHVLEAARLNAVRQFMFSSTSAIYGETAVIPTPEDAPFPVQTSLYGASKLAGEGMMQAYAEAFGIQVFVFRFVSLLGERYGHGHIFDFCRSLRKDPTLLHVLGNGAQKKSYIYVQDCIEAILLAMEKATAKVNVFNLGTDEYSDVNNSIRIICERLGVKPKITYGGGDRGWVGDSPFIFLDCARIKRLGWKARTSINEGIGRTVDYLVENPWLLEDRER